MLWQSDSRDVPSISQCYGHKELLSHGQVQICTPTPTDNTNKACLPSQQLLGKQMCQQLCAYYFSKTRTLTRRLRHSFLAYHTSLIKAHFITN